MRGSRKRTQTDPNITVSRKQLFQHASVYLPLSGHICVGFTLCSAAVRLPGSGSDGPVSLGLQPHRKDPRGVSVRGAGAKVCSG